MKKIFYSTLILILTISCEKQININQKYSDFQTDLNDLEKRNLYGNVKECSLYHTTINTDEKSQAEKSKLINKEIFTEFGSILNSENYDLNGEINRSEIYFYDKNNKLTKIIYKVGSTTSVHLFRRNSNTKTEIKTSFVNNRKQIEFISEYGNYNNVTKLITIKDRDTSVRNSNYKFDSKNNITYYEYETPNGDKNIRKYKYDENGNIIEKIYHSGKSLRKRISEYKDNILTKITEFKILPDSTETLALIIEYDKNYNAVSVNVYKDDKLYRETRNEYVFDKYGNWIEQKTYIKRNYRDSNEFQLMPINTRKIIYWE